jgi:uncharacterized RDD family membrane protein YckC
VGLRLPPSGFTDRTAALAGVRYASWLRRFGGAFLDGLIVGMIEYVATKVFFIAAPSLLNGTLAFVVFVSVVTPISLIYATLCLAKLDGQTPGMRIFQIRCKPVQGHGLVSMPQAFTRSLCAEVLLSGPLLVFGRFGGLVSLLVVVVPLAAYLWPLIDGRRQTWWDHVAATVVLDDRGW